VEPAEPEPRVAGPDDLERIVGLAATFRAWLALPGPSDAQMRARLPQLLGDAANEILLADDASGTSVAYLQIRFRPSLWYGPDAEVEDLFVAESARAAGVGRRLFAFAIERARARGCRHIGLNTNERNRAAVALYESFGLDARRGRWAGGRQIWLDREL
jgi:GNAT superfamily N-acetyltransferase